MSQGRVRRWGGLRRDVPNRSRALTSQRLRTRLALLLLAGDLTGIWLPFVIAPFFRSVSSSWLAIPLVVAVIYTGTALNSGAYSIAASGSTAAERAAAVRSLFFTFCALFLVSYFFRIEQQQSRVLLSTTMVAACGLVLTIRILIGALIDRWWRSQLFTQVVLDAGSSTRPLPLPHGTVRLDAAQRGIRPDLRDPAMMDQFAKLVRGVDRIVIVSPPEQRKDWAMMLKGANVLGEVLVDDLSDVGAFGIGRLGSFHTLTVSCGPLSVSQMILKRALDLALCVPILIALAPVLVVIAIAIKLDSRGSVFFRQRRVGQGNAFFEILKFRSMHNDLCDADGNVSTRRDDDRITRVGRFIRRTSIDELPQLLNVLGGSMSLVGPRPHALGSLAGAHLFWDVDERYWQRHALKPGITGLAQVRGFRGATHHRDDLANRLEADLEYATNWSVGKDITILFATFRVVIHHNTF